MRKTLDTRLWPSHLLTYTQAHTQTYRDRDEEKLWKFANMLQTQNLELTA